MKFIVVSTLLIYTSLWSDSLREFALSKGLRAIPSEFEVLKSQVDSEENPMTLEKIKLGKKLFFDKNLSLNRDISCASCHEIKKGGADSKPTAIGHKTQENPSHLNTPTVLNTAYSRHFFWDGRASSLREQAAGPMQAHFEMASTKELVVERVNENIEYDDNLSFSDITSAIAVYEKTLVTRGSFDEFLEGDASALNDSAKKGLTLFIKLGCKACHFGPAVGGRFIQKFPLRDYNSIVSITSTYNDKNGKREFNEFKFNVEMKHAYPFENVGGFMGKDGRKKFRVPILRNISKTAPYFHNGVVKTLREAINIMAKYQIGVQLTPIQLDDLEEFLKSLNGELVEYDLDI